LADTFYLYVIALQDGKH